MSIEDEIPMRPPVMCAGCPHRGIFYTLKKNKCMVYGDIGCYTLGAVAPLNSMDLNVCMGASCSGLHGFNLAMGEAGSSKAVNIALMGRLSKYFEEISYETWQDAIEKNVPAKFLELNKKAFELGRNV